MKSSWLLVLPILFFSVSAPAQWPDTKEKTERIFRDANLGDPKAQTYLGRMYDNGKGGVPLDHAEAAKWYRKAAEQGNQKAQWQLGRAYHKGEGVPLDLAEAENWYGKAAYTGHREAEAALRSMFESGERVPRAIAEAEKLYRTDAEQGNAQAQWLLGRGYYEGAVGLPRYLAEGEKWYRKAADQGLVEAQVALGDIFYEGIFYRGTNVPRNNVEAEKWYRKAAEQGNAKAKKYLLQIQSSKAMHTHETVAFRLFPFILAFSGLAIWRVKRLRKKLLPATNAEATSQRQKTWTDHIGIIVILSFFGSPFLILTFPPSMFLLLSPFIALLLSCFAFCIRVAIRYDSSPWRVDSLQTTGFTGVAWLCYGLYEMQLFQWMQIKGGNPIRADLIILAPLLYIATVSVFRFWWTVRDTHTKST